MILVYLLTVIIVGAWALKTINDKESFSLSKRLTINHTPLDIPLLLFLLANILSTIFSIDKHTSIWGYYSRSNGGLISLISYLLLYWAFVSNIKKDQINTLLKFGLLSGLIVSLWGIFEHFGVSPSCVILRQELNASCWVQDVQARVFATLGQPNWMASYLGMLIFPALYLTLTAKTKRQTIIYYLLSIIYYLGFTFTYSRGGFAGLLVGLAVFFALTYKENLTSIWRGVTARRGSRQEAAANEMSKDARRDTELAGPRAIRILVAFLFINILFGSALTRFNFFHLLPTSTSEVTSSTSEVKSSLTQLESGGTESGQIRWIVWQGALDIFKHYPIFGSGVETFAYSYYQYRPVAHNLTSEWDFLYNKAHNEFLNYLATTGIVGLGTYLLVIGVFLCWSIKNIVIARNEVTNQSLQLTRSPRSLSLARDDVLLIVALLAAYISYLVSNFFGFSTVSTALFFFLFPALAFVASDSLSTLHLPLSIIYRYRKIFSLAVIVVTCYLLLVTSRIWYADTLFASGMHSAESGNTGQAYNSLNLATTIRNNPYYLSELASAAASSALALEDTDATLSGTLKEAAIIGTEEVLAENPKNISFWRTAIRTYYDLTLIDDSLNQKLLSVFDTTISLAPTDPKLLYNKAIVLGTLDRNDEAIEMLKKAIELKPNYTDAYFALGLFYFDQKKFPEAVSTMRNVLKIAPNDTDAINKLNDWGKEGIATGEAKARQSL